MFWERSVRFGVVTGADIVGLREASRQTGDPSVYDSDHVDGLPLAGTRLALPEALSAAVFFQSGCMPACCFAGGATSASWPRPCLPAGIITSEPTPARARSRSTATSTRSAPCRSWIITLTGCWRCSTAMASSLASSPCRSTKRHGARSIRRCATAFAAYLAGYERRYRRFHVASDIMPHWPDRFFGDQFCHLNPAGAERFSDLLAQRLQEAPPRTQNEAQKGWLSETGAAASAKVVPISKRGS